MIGGALVPLLVSVVTAATPLALASLGELVTERAGVLNLGVEGLMLVGAVAGFAVMSATGSDVLGVLAGAGAGVALAAVFAALTLGLATSQVATGLALTILGQGLSTLAGARLTGRTVPALPKLAIPVVSDVPVIGPLLLHQDGLVYASLAAAFVLSAVLRTSRLGLVLRAVGENDDAAHRLGYRVLRIRLLAVLFGGAMGGLGGAYLSLAYTPLWAEGMTAGRGWIALALVVFGSWRPLAVLAGAYLFGGIEVLQLYLQGSGLIHVPSQLFSTVPYVATIVVLALMSSGRARRTLAAPACLGKPFRDLG